MADLDTTSRRMDIEDWHPLSAHASPWCLLDIEIWKRVMRPSKVLEYAIQKTPNLPIVPNFLPPPPENTSAQLTDRDRILLTNEYLNYRFRAELDLSQRSRIAVPQIRTEHQPAWEPLSILISPEQRQRFGLPPIPDTPDKGKGRFLLLCRPDQAFSLLGSSEPGLVLMQFLMHKSSGPKGAWWKPMRGWLRAVSSPLLIAHTLIPLDAPPDIPLVIGGRPAPSLNEIYSRNGLWTLASSQPRLYDPVADGM